MSIFGIVMWLVVDGQTYLGTVEGDVGFVLNVKYCVVVRVLEWSKYKKNEFLICVFKVQC